MWGFKYGIAGYHSPPSPPAYITVSSLLWNTAALFTGLRFKFSSLDLMCNNIDFNTALNSWDWCQSCNHVDVSHTPIDESRLWNITNVFSFFLCVCCRAANNHPHHSFMWFSLVADVQTRVLLFTFAGSSWSFSWNATRIVWRLQETQGTWGDFRYERDGIKCKCEFLCASGKKARKVMTRGTEYRGKKYAKMSFNN